MTASTDENHARLPQLPLLRPVRVPVAVNIPLTVALSLALVVSASSAGAGPAQQASTQSERGSLEVTEDGDSVCLQQHRGELLQAGLVEDGPPPGAARKRKSRGARRQLRGVHRRRRSVVISHRGRGHTLQRVKDTVTDEELPMSGNSFITLKAPSVQKAAAPPQNVEDPPPASLPQHLPSRDSVGMRVVRLWSKSLVNLTSLSPQVNGISSRWLEAVLLHGLGWLMTGVTSIVLVYTAFDLFRNWRHRAILRHQMAIHDRKVMREIEEGEIFEKLEFPKQGDR